MNNVTLTGTIDSVSEIHVSNNFTMRHFILRIETLYQDKVYKELIQITLFGDSANTFIGKQGDDVFVSGKVKGRQYQDNQGNAKYSVSISASEVKFFSKQENVITKTNNAQDGLPF